MLTVYIIAGTVVYAIGWILLARWGAGWFHAKRRTKYVIKSRYDGFVKLPVGEYQWTAWQSAWAAYPLALIALVPVALAAIAFVLAIGTWKVVSFPAWLGKRITGRLTESQRAHIKHVFVAPRD